MSMPDLSPLIFTDLVCRQCGKTMKKQVVMGRRGQKTVATHILYTCANKESGCDYRVESTDMLRGEMKGIPVQRHLAVENEEGE